ncbi:MAG: metallophosphoesterase, partial [Traorella sp.]
KLISTKIDESNTSLKIAFISDIHYNHYMNHDRLEYMIQKINDNQPDIIIFGGDLFDDPTTYGISDETRKELIELLKSLDADYGKFAVLGEEDHYVDDVEDILFEADFELLNNESILISKNESKAINLIGIDCLINGNPDIEAAFENVDSSNYTIVVTHAPDLTSQLPVNSIDLILSAHSHGGQVYLPIIGALYRPEGAQTYNYGTYYLNNTTLIVSNGLGTTNEDFRLFSQPQCHMIRFEPYY